MGIVRGLVDKTKLRISLYPPIKGKLIEKQYDQDMVATRWLTSIT